MARKKSIDPKTRIAAATLRVAARQAWAHITLEQIAKAAKLPLPALQKNFAHKNAILIFIAEQHNRHCLATVAQADNNTTPRDLAFEALMARFDQLQSHRAAFLALLQASRRDPSLTLQLARPIYAGMAALAQRIAPQAQMQQRLIVAGLFAIYINTLCVWRRDASDDLTATMAALDKALRRATRAAGVLFRQV